MLLAPAGLTLSELVFAAIALSHAGRVAQAPDVAVESA